MKTFYENEKEPLRLDMKNMLIAVMSYNRGEYLAKCISALERHLPNITINIYDDDSTCNETKKVLEQLKLKYKVYTAGTNRKIGKHKGLYENMNVALDDAINNKYNYIFYIQDDIQLVRSASGEFLKECEKIFSSDSKIVQIQPVFFKGVISKHEYDLFTKINKDVGYYTGNAIGINGIADVGITRVELLMENNWRFLDGEINNMSVGSNLGWKYVKPKNPIMMYTPWPETFRNKKGFKKNIMKLADRIFKAGHYSYFDMNEKEVHRLCNRPIEEYPFPEDYLRIDSDMDIVTPWHYSSSYEYILTQIGNFLKKIHLYKFAKKLMGLFKK